jgi:hypothetical protein
MTRPIEKTVPTESRWPLTAIGAFLFFGAIMALLAGATLIWRGTFLDRMWSLNTSAYKQLSAFGRTVGIPFFVLSIALAVAGVAWFKRRLWGWWLAVGIITTQLLGDVVSVSRGDLTRGGTGFVIAGALLFYLFRPNVKAAFSSREISTSHQRIQAVSKRTTLT